MENADQYIGEVGDRSKINENIASLQETEGWKNLSPQQQKMIRTSLLISNRAFRETDPASVDAIGNSMGNGLPMILQEKDLDDTRRINPNDKGVYLLGYEHDPKGRKYGESQNLIALMNCHKSVYSLEISKFVDEDPKKVDPTFFQAEYKDVGDFTDPDQSQHLEAHITEKEFPCVVIVNSQLSHGKMYPPELCDHTFLAMGHDKNGQILCWDKEDFGRPFRVLPLSQMLEAHNSNPFWGVRSLENRQPIAVNIPAVIGSIPVNS